MRSLFISVCLFLTSFAYSQEKISSVMTLEEYLGYVKNYHPIVKQASLILGESEAELLKARGAFDPKLEVDFDRKKFKNTEYYDKLNATFKIPTWYGVELKANFEENSGTFLNPELNVPEDGLYSVGVSVPLARGLLVNKRMAMLKQAKLFIKQTEADRQLLINDILFEASKTYFDWLQAYQNKKVYESFLVNASVRFNGIKKDHELGERPAIDTLEARIALNNRKLNLEKAHIGYIKSSLELSNYLWLNNNTPVELQENIIPDVNTDQSIDKVLNVLQIDITNLIIDDHPKLRSLEYKYKGLEVDKRLKFNRLLPEINLEYNFLTETPEVINSLNTLNYKSGLNVRFPLFLRKERGDLKLAKLKLQNTQFEISTVKVNLSNKINAIRQEVESFIIQNSLTQNIVKDYEILLNAEERKFDLGESSLFLINSRESKLIEAKLKAIALENKFFTTKASLFNTVAAGI